MKTLFFVLIISAFFYSCGSSDQEDKSKYASNPCNDSLFIALKQKSIDSLTERQYQYVRDKEKDCNEYTAFQKKQKTYEKDVSSSSNMRTVWIVLAIVSIVSTIAALIIILPKH